MAEPVPNLEEARLAGGLAEANLGVQADLAAARTQARAEWVAPCRGEVSQTDYHSLAVPVRAGCR